MTTTVQADREQRKAAAKQVQADVAIRYGLIGRERGIYRDAARRFFQNKLSMFGFALVILLLVLAIFADDALIALPLGREPKPLIARTAYDEAFYGPVSSSIRQIVWEILTADLWKITESFCGRYLLKLGAGPRLAP